MTGFSQHELVADPHQIKINVDEAYRTIGYLLDGIQDSALLVDALSVDCPIVGATQGFCELSGYPLNELIGQNCRMMLQGVPKVALSKSARKNMQNYCSMCQVAGLSDISEVAALQPNARKNGSHFVNFFMLGLCKVRHHHFILGVQVPLSEGLVARVPAEKRDSTFESARGIFKNIRDTLQMNSGIAVTGDDGTERGAPCFKRQAVVAQPDFAFFAERLQDHCVLINNGFTAIRREPGEVTFHCMCFGDRPVRRTSKGLSFTVHVDEVTPSFTGLPVLGFTKRRPVDEPGLYPVATRCLGSSVLVGACGEAFARDQHEHFSMTFKQPKQDEVQTWALQPDLPSHKRYPPVEIKPGDLLHCIYLRTGRIQLKLNEDIILDFDVERPVDNDAEYYAVVDVCFAAFSLTVMPSPQDEEREGSMASTDASYSCSWSEDDESCSALEPSYLSAAVDEFLVTKGIREAVRECKFMVTIADPRGKDCPLIAVSDEFESMTGYTKDEILGANCRFLNTDCDMDPSDLANLRLSSATGVPFTAVVPNRKKSGELFLNLLDIRGLSVATNSAGEDLWFLIGIQADVTELMDGDDFDDFKKDHLAELSVVADAIRVGIAREISRMAVDGAVKSESEMLSPKSASSWRLLREPAWRHKSSLGNRHPDDSPVAEALAREVHVHSSVQDNHLSDQLDRTVEAKHNADNTTNSTASLPLSTKEAPIEPAGHGLRSKWLVNTEAVGLVTLGLGVALATACVFCLNQRRRP